MSQNQLLTNNICIYVPSKACWIYKVLQEKKDSYVASKQFENSCNNGTDTQAKKLLSSGAVLGWKSLLLGVFDSVWITSFFLSFCLFFLPSCSFFLCLRFSNNQRNSKCEQRGIKKCISFLSKSPVPVGTFSGDSYFCSFWVASHTFYFFT